MSLVEQELPTLPEHLNSLPGSSGVRVTRSLVLYVCFVDRCLSFCTFSFGHWVVCSSSIYGFWLHLWYHQSLLKSPCEYENKRVQEIKITLVKLLHKLKSELPKSENRNVEITEKLLLCILVYNISAVS